MNINNRLAILELILLTSIPHRLIVWQLHQRKMEIIPFKAADEAQFTFKAICLYGILFSSTHT